MRIGFLGAGWIGRARMQAALATGLVAEALLVEPEAEARAAALAAAPQARVCDTYAALLAEEPDGVAIATPSALHAAQAIEALDAGAAVFCQKPIGRNADEVEAALAAARKADRLFAADFSYRRTRAMQEISRLVRSGELGRIHFVDLVFHNAYGPDKNWFYDRAASGGGCMMDLGVHLIDLALWTLGNPAVEVVSSDLLQQGRIPHPDSGVEDLACATLRTQEGACIRIACSWRLAAGADAAISGAWYGAQGGAGFSNVDGSFYDFQAERYIGVRRESLARPPDPWGGRAIEDWVRRLSVDRSYAASANEYAGVARTLDAIYRAGGLSPAGAGASARRRAERV